MRDLINIVESYTPPQYEESDDPHYDALKTTGFFGAQAAGCIALSKSTGRILLLLRSDAVEQPRTWGNCGGAHHSNETPIFAAQRELKEETGYTGNISIIPLYVFKKGTFTYSNFLALVDDEFVPDLGWEAIDYKWCDYGNWPKPLHFGMEALFSDNESVNTIRHYIDILS